MGRLNTNTENRRGSYRGVLFLDSMPGRNHMSFTWTLFWAAIATGSGIGGALLVRNDYAIASIPLFVAMLVGIFWIFSNLNHLPEINPHNRD